MNFRCATLDDKSLLIKWHKAAHVQEFWDTSDNQLNNMLGFLEGRKDIFEYWICSDAKDIDFALIMTSEFIDDGSPGLENYEKYFAKGGPTHSIDFMIGEESHLGRGLASVVLGSFMKFLKDRIGVTKVRFLIDPDQRNLKAVKAYERAGFKKVGEFTPKLGAFKGVLHSMMLRDL